MAERGLILVDTKYEFGTDADGRVVLADEIHTPDSSRFWRASSYAERFERGEAPESFDKDFVRAWVAARCDPYRDPIPEIPAELIRQTAQRYIEAFEQITGQRFPSRRPGRRSTASGLIWRRILEMKRPNRLLAARRDVVHGPARSLGASSMRSVIAAVPKS